MNTCFFSIIIPCYNAATFLKEALLSFESQTFDDFEIILVDDCSQDDTFSFCQKWIGQSNRNIKLYKNKVNSGPGITRNVGIEKASGLYIVFCDSDDWYESHFLSTVFNHLSKNSADIVLYDLYRVYSNGKKDILNWTSKFTPLAAKEKYVALAADSLCSMVIKRELFAKVSIAQLYNAEDMITIPLLVAEAEKVTYISIPLYNYQYRQKSLSTSISIGVVDNFWDAYLFLASHKGKYHSAIEFRCIKVVIYGLVYNAIKCKLDNQYIREKINLFKLEFPNWYSNQYIKFLPFRKRAWLYCVHHHLYFPLRTYCIFQQFYFKRKSR